MFLWNGFVGFLAMCLFALAQLYGGNLGLAIITLSLIVRLALLPVTLGLARRARDQQERLRRIQPEIDRLRRKYPNDRERQSMEVLKLYKKAGVQPLDGKSLLGNLAQFPVAIGLMQAINTGLKLGSGFLWIDNLSLPDVLLAVLTAGLTLLASFLSPDVPRQSRLLFTLLPAVVTLILAWRLAAGVGLYWATSTAVGLVQTALLNRWSGKK